MYSENANKEIICSLGWYKIEFDLLDDSFVKPIFTFYFYDYMLN